MKFTLSWLKCHLETSASLEEIVARLTSIGLEVDSVEDPSEALKDFSVGAVQTCDKHPNADKLSLCKVETSEGPVQIICGASNVRKGLKVIVATPGTYIPGSDFTIKEGVIRGEVSNGMLCSTEELNLPAEEQDGIAELPEDAVVGSAVASWLGLDDPVIDVDLTPNRQDCTGVRGIARDLAAAGLGTLKDHPIPTIELKKDHSLRVEIDPKAPCPAFATRVITGLTNGPSPQWLQKQLTAVGLRPISALVDVTNWMTLDQARPLHVFDLKKLTGTPKVRLAKTGESFDALNDKNYTLEDGMTVIADDSAVLSLAGIMGGLSTGCQEDTTEILLEAALWDKSNIAQTGRRLGIISDARYRFERGVDPQALLDGLDRATALILELCGGEAGPVELSGALPEPRSPLFFDPSLVEKMSGLAVPKEEIESYLSKLGFKLTPKKEGYDVHIPAWRQDIDGPADLVEEVLRLLGYDHIPAVSLRTEHLPEQAVTPLLKQQSLMRRVLANQGLQEALTFSFLDQKIAALFGAEDDALTLENPIASDLGTMRPSLVPNLLSAAVQNSHKGTQNAAFFETGKTFHALTPEGQKDQAAGVRVGFAIPRQWIESERSVDAFDAKADALAVLKALGAPTNNLQTQCKAPSWYHPGRSGALTLGPKILAVFGELHPKITKAFGLKERAVAFEIYPDALPLKRKKGTQKPLFKASPFMPVHRDLAFVLDEKVTAEQLIKVVKGVDKKLITEATLFDEYKGKGIEDGQKSLAIEFQLQPLEQTLTDKEIDAVMQAIIEAVSKNLSGTLR